MYMNNVDMYSWNIYIPNGRFAGKRELFCRHERAVSEGTRRENYKTKTAKTAFSKERYTEKNVNLLLHLLSLTPAADTVVLTTSRREENTDIYLSTHTMCFSQKNLITHSQNR